MPQEFVVPATGQRFVIVHFHIFKNGGSTIESILEREFSSAYATLHGPRPDSVLMASDLAAFLNQHPEIRAISSHHLRYPLSAVPNTVLFDCCFLRHPLARLHSEYSFFRRIDLDYSLCHLAHQENIREFFWTLLDRLPHLVSNVQVVQLANSGEFRRPAAHHDLERASAILRDMAIPGVVEMFDESLAAAEYFLRPAFPELSLEYVAHNVSQTATTSEPFEQILGTELFEQLLRVNELDLELFRRATSEIKRRMSLAPSFDQRLSDFKSRCARFQGTPTPA